MPREALLSGKVLLAQTDFYKNKKKRLNIAQLILEGAAFNMVKNLRYYNSRGKDLEPIIDIIEELSSRIAQTTAIDELMGIEGNIRQIYYSAFDTIINDFEMNGRGKQPPSNEVNALISFGNMMCYTLTLDMIYHTQLNPTISFLHEPGYRRFSLALDISEIFRTIFRVLNKKEIRKEHFDDRLNGCYLKEPGKKIFIRAWEERLEETIKHRNLNKNVSYKQLVKLECYKLTKYILKDRNIYHLKFGGEMKRLKGGMVK